MAFDQNMIIDATTGSIARFVNHSCDPNCRMEKWIVHGQPRMALFAGEKPIMTGDELTYDYNFDPFSAKNVQKCLCGSANCRGVLGPKVSRLPKGEAKVIKETVKAATKVAKRKLQALVGVEDAGSPSKKRKIAKATGAKKGALAKAAAAIKKTANSISVNAKAALAAAAKPKAPTAHVSVRKATLVKASKVYTKNGKQLMLADTIVSKSSTIVAAPKAAPKKKAVAKNATAKTATAKSATAKSVTAKKAVTKKAVATKATGKAPVKAKAAAKATTTKTASRSAIKATIKSAGVKGSVKGTIKSAKHTISKTTGKKTVVKKTTRVAKQSILASPEEDAPAAEGGSISVKGPQKALELSPANAEVESE